MSEGKTLLLKFDFVREPYTVIFDDDGRVAYAYLLTGDEIIADVWLYNHGIPPVKPEWNDRRTMPFANSAEFVAISGFAPVKEPDEIKVVWTSAHTELPSAEVHIRNKLHARLVGGVKPGWCVLAIKDGPLAKVLR